MAKSTPMSSPTRSSRKRVKWWRRQPTLIAGLILMVTLAAAINLVYPLRSLSPGVVTPQPLSGVHANAGKILWRGETTTFSAAQVETISRENYGATTPRPLYGVTETVVRYRSYDLDDTPIVVYARVYLPVGKTGASIFGFAPGTTGIGDECAPSIEDPHKANWANYQSHLVTYAGQGYASVITDYEGMRDSNRIHHYMVGELEGRAVLDSVRALMNLDSTHRAANPKNVFLGGYSQGGHSAFWADQIASAYAPDLTVKGVVGFGPVMDVQQTWSDILHAANINWFGPYVLTSYADYYHDTYDINQILTPRYAANLRADVLAHCIDTDLMYWGHVPNLVYTTEFLASLSNGLNDPRDAQLKARLEANRTGSAPTSSAKLINEGARDNVVLPAQQTAAMQRICPTSRGPAQLKVYPNATHYNTMAQSLHDTITWMKDVAAGQAVPTTCSP